MPKLGLGLGIPKPLISGGGSAPVIPPDGLSLWLKADAGVTLDGPSVTNWADQSGGVAFAGPYDEYPIFNASDLNGKPTISLSSLEGNIRPFELLNANSVMGATGTTAFAVVYVEDVCEGFGNDNGPIFGNFGTTIDNDPPSQGHYPYGPQCSVYDSFCTTSRKEALTPPATIENAWSLYSVSSTNDDWRAYVNGSLMHSDVNNNYNNTPYNSALYIGYQDADGAYTLKGKIAEAITYNRVLTTPERQQVETYLNTKYAIY
jgi:hypothetical protein